MSEQPDEDSKTEDPSEKKISDAVKKGNLPVSREVSIFVSLLGMLIIAKFTLMDGGLQLAAFLARFIENPGDWRFDEGRNVISLLEMVTHWVFPFLLPIFLIFTIGALVGAFMQNAPSIVLHRIKPDFSKLSLKKGMKRVFGAQGWVEFSKAISKFVIISVVVSILLNSEIDKILTTITNPPTSLPKILLALTFKLLATVTVATSVMVAADIVWSRKQWFKNLRMTKQEVKDEHKQAEGDPIVKAKRLSLARDRLRRQMIAAVPKATVVITNPTHYSIALRYDADLDAAPVVVALGQDLIALKIREVAEANNIPMVENRLLAQSLYKQVEVDQIIPEEFYRAVAEIIHFVSAQSPELIRNP